MLALVGRGGFGVEDYGGSMWWAMGCGGMVSLGMGFSGGSSVWWVWWVCLVFAAVTL